MKNLTERLKKINYKFNDKIQSKNTDILNKKFLKEFFKKYRNKINWRSL